MVTNGGESGYGENSPTHTGLSYLQSVPHWEPCARQKLPRVYKIQYYPHWGAVARQKLHRVSKLQYYPYWGAVARQKLHRVQPASVPTPLEDGVPQKLHRLQPAPVIPPWRQCSTEAAIPYPDRFYLRAVDTDILYQHQARLPLTIFLRHRIDSDPWSTRIGQWYVSVMIQNEH